MAAVLVSTLILPVASGAAVRAAPEPANEPPAVAAEMPLGREMPAAPAHVTLTPSRVLDTREAIGLVPPGTTVTANLNGVPRDAAAAVLNVTAANATGDGYLTVWDCTGPVPATSNLNYVGVTTIANSVITSVGDDGEICVETGQHAAHVIVDVLGYFRADSGVVGLSPTRALDTRDSGGPVQPGATVPTRLPGVPADATAAVVNVTAANATGDGHFTVWDCSGGAPGASNGSYVGLRTIANSVITGVGDDGEICVTTARSSAHLIVDVQGYLSAESDFIPAAPWAREQRIQIAGGGSGRTAVTPGVPTVVTLDGIPAGSAAVLNVTASNATGDGYFTVWNCIWETPPTSNGNFVGVRTIANTVITAVSDNGEICVQTGQESAEISVDVLGHMPTELGPITANTTDPDLPPASREQLVVDVAVEPAEVRAGDTAELNLSITAPGGFPPLDVSVRLDLADGLSLGSLLDSPAQCSGTDTSTPVCRIAEQYVEQVLAAPITLPLNVAGDAEGLRGVTAIAWFGDETPEARTWQASREGTEADAAMLSVAAVTGVAPAVASGEVRLTPEPEPTLDIIREPGVTVDPDPEPDLDPEPAPAARAAPADAAPRSDPPPSAFCDLFGAVASVSTTVTAGPFTFSSLNQSSNSGGGCTSASTITLSGADLDINGVVFNDITGTVTPTTVTLHVEVNNTGVGLTAVDLTITGPFPDTGSAFSAALSFDVGSTSVALNGSIDYATAGEFALTLNATADGFDWRPAAGLTVADAGISGRFTRTTAGDTVTDTFDIGVEFGGSWSPLEAITVSEITAEIGNTSGDLEITLGASLDGRVDMAGLVVDMPASITGVVDLDTEQTTLTVDIDPFTIADVVTLGPAAAVLTHDPSAPAGESSSSAMLSGTAAFAGALEQFFDDSVSGSIHLFDDGYVATAEIDKGAPATSGYSFPTLHLAYAGLTNPAVPLQYSPPESSGGSSTSGVTIPLMNGAAMAIAPFGVPTALADSLDTLGIELFNDIGSGVAAISLPPADPALSIHYAPPGSPYLFGTSSSATSMRFDDIFATVSLGEAESFSIGGDVTLTIPSATLQLESAITVSASETGVNLGGYLELSDAGGWQNALGIEGLTIDDLEIQAGITDDGPVVTPSFGFEATASFPDSVTRPIGVVDGSVITIGINLSVEAPCFVFDIEPGTPGANVLDIGDGAITATDASLILAPLSCTFAQTTYSGYNVKFDGAINGVNVGFDTSFTLTPEFSLSGSGYVGSFPIGGVTMDQTTVNLSISATSFSFSLNGGMRAGDALVAQGTMLIDSGGGFDFSGSGTIDIGGDDAAVSVAATNCSNSTCTSLTTPSFNASGDIDIQGFRFSASLLVSADGEFDARLSIPKQTAHFSFDRDGVKGAGTLTYSLSVDVSNTGRGGLSFSGGVSLSSCRVGPFGCGRPGLSASGDIKVGRIDVTIEVRVVVHFRISMTV